MSSTLNTGVVGRRAGVSTKGRFQADDQQPPQHQQPKMLLENVFGGNSLNLIRCEIVLMVLGNVGHGTWVLVDDGWHGPESCVVPDGVVD